MIARLLHSGRDDIHTFTKYEGKYTMVNFKDKKINYIQTQLKIRKMMGKLI